MFKSPFFSGLLGGILVFTILFMLSIFYFNIHSYNIRIINPKVIDSLEFKTDKINLMSKMEKEGILLTPQEFTNNIVSYYNTSITVLVFLFILFSIISYFQLRVISNEQVQKSLEEGLKDSKKFQDIIMTAISGKADDKYTNIETTEIIQEDLETLQEDLLLLQKNVELLKKKGNLNISEDEIIKEPRKPPSKKTYSK
jgi:hypothetical protein